MAKEGEGCVKTDKDEAEERLREHICEHVMNRNDELAEKLLCGLIKRNNAH